MQQGSDGAALGGADAPVPMVARVEGAVPAIPAAAAAQPDADQRGAAAVTPAAPAAAASEAVDEEQEDEEGEAEATEEEVNNNEEAEEETATPQQQSAAPVASDAAAPPPALPPASMTDAAPQQPRTTKRRTKSKPVPRAPISRAAASQHLDDDPSASQPTTPRDIQPEEASSPAPPMPMLASIAAAPGGASERSSNSESSQQPQQPQRQPREDSPPTEPAPRAAESAEEEQARKRRVRRAAAEKAAAAAAAGEEAAARDELPAAKPQLTRQNALPFRKRRAPVDAPADADAQSADSREPSQEQDSRSSRTAIRQRQSKPRSDEEPQASELPSSREQQQHPKTKKRPRGSRTNSIPTSPKSTAAASSVSSSDAKLPDDVVGPEDREDVEAGETNGEAAAGRPTKSAVAAVPSVYDALADQQPEQGSALGAAKHALGGSDLEDSEESQAESALTNEASPAIDETPAAAPTPNPSATTRGGMNQAAKRINERLKPPPSSSQRKRPIRTTITPDAPLGRDEMPFSEETSQQSQPTEPTPRKPMDPALAFQAAKDRAAELADLQGVPAPKPLERPVPPPFREPDAGLEPAAAAAAEPASKTNGGGSVVIDNPLLPPTSSRADVVVDAPPSAGAVADSSLVSNPSGSLPSAAEPESPPSAGSPPPQLQPIATIETDLAEPPPALHELKLQDASNLTNAYLSRVTPAEKQTPSPTPSRDAAPEEAAAPAPAPAVPSPAADAAPMPAPEMPVVTPPAVAAPEPEVRQPRLDPKESDAAPSAPVDTPAPAPVAPAAAVPAPAPIVPAPAPPSANPLLDSPDSIVTPASPSSPSLVDPSVLPEPEWRKVDRPGSGSGGSSGTGFVLLFAFVSFCGFLCVKLKRMIGGEESGSEHETGETGGLLSPSSGVQMSSSPRSRPPIKPGQVVLDSLTDEEDPEMGFALRHNGGGASSLSNSNGQQHSSAAESTAPAPSNRGMSLKSAGRQAARPTSLKKGKLGLGVKQLDNESD